MRGVNSFLIRKIRRQRYNSITLISITAIVTFIVIGGSLFLLELSNGLIGMEKRLGADMMIVPGDCKNTAESILLEGSREYFYFDSATQEAISKADGIEEVTSQFYLASLAADCCTTQVGIVGFNPDTDFIIWPWVQEKDRMKIKKGMVIVGSNIKLEKDGTIRIFDRTYSVGSKLAETGTSLDTSVYLTMDTIPQLINDAEGKGLNFMDTQKNQNAISSVFVKLKKGSSQRDVARAISNSMDVDVDIVYPKDILHSFAENTQHIISNVHILLGVLLLVAESVIVLVCHISSGKRKKEYALLRVLGVSQKQLIYMQMKEVLLLASMGFLLGTFGATITVFPFGRYFAQRLKFAYIQPSALKIILLVITAGFVSILAAVTASVVTVIKVSKLDAYSAMREEE